MRRGPLWEIHLICLGERRHLLALSFSHIIVDGWSASVLVSDIVHAYQARLGRGPARTEPVIDHEEIARVQQRLMPGTPAHLAYWRDRLVPPPKERPFPVLDPPGDADLLAEAAHDFDLGSEFGDRLAEVSWDMRAAPLTVLMAAYHVMLARRIGQDRVIVGTTTMGRETAAARNVVGQFTNNLYLAANVRPDASFVAVVDQVHTGLEQGLAHLTSFRQTARTVHPNFESQRPWPFLHFYHSWFQALSPDAPELVYPNLKVEYLEWAEVEPPHGTKTLDDPKRTPLWIKRGTPAIIINNNRHSGAMVYSPRFFSDQTVSDAVDDYVALLEDVVRDPKQHVGSMGTGARL